MTITPGTIADGQMTGNGDTNNWERIESLFAEVLEMPVEERSGFLDDACGTDTPVRKEVDRLLAADATGTGVLDLGWNPADGEQVRGLSGLADGQTVGAWRIISELGRGGMGVVYLAERADGTYEQQVALKIIRGGLLAAAMEPRFIRERHILGRLQHPNIAHLLDAGATADGLPFLVMELVQGAPITDWCRQHQSSIDERLRLILQACDALQHAHQNLVVHRDLKPGNIFINASGTVRLLDFGVARLLSDNDDNGQHLTRQGMLPLTPVYAAPEQLSDVNVTTAADIYSLGAVLYELMTNRRPREGLTGSPVEIQELMQHAVPAPSTNADASPQWCKRLRGDLDAIVQKAMAPDPARRYATATVLADDIRRYLRHEPVQARPEGVSYRVAKFVKRHRIGVAAMLAIAVAISAGVTATAWQASKAATQAAKAESVKDFLLSLFEGVDPSRALGEELSARQLVDDGAERMQSEFDDQPLVRAEVLTFLADMYDKLDDDDRALELIDQAFEVIGEQDAQEFAQALLVQGRILVGRSDDEAGTAALERALPMLAGLQRDFDAAEAMDLLSIVRARHNELVEATKLTEAALTLRLRLLGEEHTEVASSYNNLGVLARKQGDYPAARQHYERALDIRRRVLPADHPQLAISLNNLGALENVDGNYVRAAAYFSESLGINQRVNGKSHHNTIAALNNFGFMQMRLGQLDAAHTALTDVHGYWVDQGKADHPNALVTRVNLAAVQRISGDSIGAFAEFEELERSLAEKLGSEHPFVAVTMHHQARCMLDLGRLDAAQILIARALELRETASGADHPDSADLIRDQALIALLQDDFESAEALATRALELQRSKLPTGHPSISMTEILLGSVAHSNGDMPRALNLQQAALDSLAALFSADYPDLAKAHFELGKTLLADRQSETARQHLREARDALSARYGSTAWQAAEVEVWLADALLQLGEDDSGMAMRADAVQRIDTQLPDYHPVRKHMNSRQPR